jgi:hypothetical protein
MIAFWIAVVVGVAVAVVYITLAAQAFVRVRRDILAAQAAGESADLSVAELDSDDRGVFTWKAAGAIVASTLVIVLIGVNPVFWYAPAILAIGTAVAVSTAFLIDRRSTS